MLGYVARTLPAAIVIGVATVVIALMARPIIIEPVWAVAGGRLVSLVLLAAGGMLWVVGTRRVAAVASVAALCWAGVVWSLERVTGADALVGAGMLLAPLLVPALVLLVLGLPRLWRVPGPLALALIVGTLVISLAGVARALVYEPIMDLHCGPFCGHSPVLLVANLGLAAWLGGVAAAASVGVCGTLALGILLARPVGTRRIGPGLPARGLAAAAMGAFSAAALASLVGDPGRLSTGGVVGLVAIRGGACLAIAAAAILVASERLAVGRNLSRLASLLADEGDRPTAESLLRDAVGDPALSVGYWTDERGYVGADGRPLAPTEPGRQRTELTSRGRPVAVVVHDPHTLPPDLVEAHIGPEARLAIQNESLELELQRRLDQLRASRRRVVEAGDAERRRLERDLHDGAQQLLLALSFEVRRGERAALDAGDEAAAARFAEARAIAARILEQLRVLAHGIHPTILTNAGIEPALATYVGALDRPPPLTVKVPHRLPPAVEASAYAIVTALVAAAPNGSSTSYAVCEDADAIRIVVDGEQPVPEHILDRLGAAGGSWAVTATGSEYVLPCG